MCKSIGIVVVEIEIHFFSNHRYYFFIRTEKRKR